MQDAAEIGFSIPLLLAGIIGMLLLALAVIVFFVVYQKRLFAQNERLREQELAYQRNLVDAAIQTQETERRRIAADLHDEIGSMLSAVRLYMRQLKPEGDPQKNADLKEQSLDILSNIIGQTRQITHNLMPPSLEQFGLVAATEDLCGVVGQSEVLDVHFSTNAEERLHADQEIALYRVLQELLNNTLKHAEAKQVWVAFNFGAQELTLTYRDDGKGFELPSSTDERRRAFGLGWKSIESRVHFVKGELEVQSAPQEGLEVQIQLPRTHSNVLSQ